MAPAMPDTQTELAHDVERLLHGDPELKADPYPLYARLRSEAPVFDAGPFALLTSHDVVKRVLLDTERFSNEVQRPGTSRVEATRGALTEDRHRAMFDHCIAVERLFLEESDGDDHARRRDISHRLFTPRRIVLHEELTQRLVDSLLDELAAGGEVVDFEKLAARLPALVIADLLGVPHEDAPQLGEWSATILANIFGGQGTPALEAAYEAHSAFEGYIDAILRDHHSGLRPTELVTALMGATESEVLRTEELYALFLEFQLGGTETARGMIVGVAYELLRRPDQWRKVAEDPSIAPRMLEEGVRYVSPVQWMARVTREDMELDGVPLAAYKTCLTMIGAANRDPAVFDDPDAFDVDRPELNRHLGFGFGRHYCLAQALARLEGRIVFSTLARRFPEVELAIGEDEVEWAGQAQLRRPKSLPVRLGREAA